MLKLKFVPLLNAVMLISFTPVCFAESINYGSKAGMQDTVISKMGLDTDHAEIHVHHTRADAISFCRDGEGSLNQAMSLDECIADDMRRSVKERVYIANCVTGLFNNGKQLFVGPSSPNPDSNPTDYLPVPDYIIVDLPNGHIEEAQTASGYYVYLDLFKALCPKRVPSSKLLH
jgi:hypothetical protein